MLLGAFGLHWLAWNLFQKLTEGRKVCNVENMVQDRRKRSAKRCLLTHKSMDDHRYCLRSSHSSRRGNVRDTAMWV
jgi:hypothetical protein